MYLVYPIQFNSSLEKVNVKNSSGELRAFMSHSLYFSLIPMKGGFAFLKPQFFKDIEPFLF